MRHFSILFVIMGMTSFLHSQTKFTVQAWVKAEKTNTQNPLILSNKNWDENKVVNFTSHHNLGQASVSGSTHGWAFAVQANGAWSWNIGDGQGRLDYLPTAEVQRINDGAWHHLLCTISEEKATASLYFDGQMVAIYNLEELENLNYLDLRRDRIQTGTNSIQLDTFAFDGRYMSRLQVESLYRQRSGKQVKKDRYRDTQLKVLNWNIWHGGRRDGDRKGLEKTIQVIRESGANVLCLQETYGSGPVIADSLGMVYFYRSTNLGVFSRYPIVETHAIYEPFHAGGVQLLLPNRRVINVFDIWLNSEPDIDISLQEPWSADRILKAEQPTRLSEINAILQELQPWLGKQKEVPLILAGDFNSPSHLDFTEATKSRHHDLLIQWPVSKAIAQAGLQDAFRQIYPDPTQNYGETWSPRFDTSCKERIDHIYYSPGSLNCTFVQKLDQHPEGWPSDHAAVLARFD